jgi:hypothetical protein
LADGGHSEKKDHRGHSHRPARSPDEPVPYSPDLGGRVGKGAGFRLGVALRFFGINLVRELLTRPVFRGGRGQRCIPKPLRQLLHVRIRLGFEFLSQKGGVDPGVLESRRPLASGLQGHHVGHRDAGVEAIHPGQTPPPDHGGMSVAPLVGFLSQPLERLGETVSQIFPFPIHPMLEFRGVADEEAVKERPAK